MYINRIFVNITIWIQRALNFKRYLNARKSGFFRLCFHVSHSVTLTISYVFQVKCSQKSSLPSLQDTIFRCQFHIDAIKNFSLVFSKKDLDEAWKGMLYVIFKNNLARINFISDTLLFKVVVRPIFQNHSHIVVPKSTFVLCESRFWAKNSLCLAFHSAYEGLWFAMGL